MSEPTLKRVLKDGKWAWEVTYGGTVRWHAQDWQARLDLRGGVASLFQASKLSVHICNAANGLTQQFALVPVLPNQSST